MPEHELVSNRVVDNILNDLFMLRLCTSAHARDWAPWEHVRAERQNGNDGYGLAVFVSGGNIDEEANDNGFPSRPADSRVLRARRQQEPQRSYLTRLKRD